MSNRLTVLGGGAWGTALAASYTGDVLLWARTHFFDPELPVRRTTDLSEALTWAPVALLAIPAQAVRSFTSDLRNRGLYPPCIIIASKGIEQTSGLLLSEVIQEVLPDVKIGALGGPNLAKEVLQKVLSGVSLAAPDPETYTHLAAGFASGPLTLTPCPDLIGVQITGALKNVMAIGYGLLQQVNTGHNLFATFLTKALQEICLFTRALGGQEATLMHFCGIGDLVLTCTSPTSRNAAFGRAFSQPSTSLETPLVEGRFTVSAALTRAQQLSLDLPLTRGIEAILTGRLPLQAWPHWIANSTLF